MTADDRAYVAAMLPKVSRTFALAIRLLPPGLEHPVGVAYLLCRIADTIEDSATLSAAEKARLLAEFRDRLGDDGAPAALVAAFAAAGADDARLAHEADRSLGAFRRLPAALQDAIRPHVQEMCDGMAEFALAHPGGTALAALPDIPSLERYCYFVAGTVGHLLTALFALHLGLPEARRARLAALATSFGLGLQLTNIVKDVTQDRDRGWSFVPAELCRQFGLAPEELLRPERRPDAMRVMRALAAKARAHLDDAVRYCTLLPRTAYGIRRFCLISVFLAARTLHLAERDERLLDPAHRLKITRGAVKRSLLTTTLIVPSDTLVRGYYRLLAG
ncbi:MAG TPA: squalene/phytoene synthase family protein [Gemmatimonadales bacterium]|jgi:farnesyl-diphosphate farnesyltransferase|nr:squalene/phytoene synthase family protein [Gemmatimonadales bacterium]